MKHIRRLSLLLALAMIFTAACGEPVDTADTDNTGDTTVPVEATSADTEAQLEVPDGLTSNYEVFSILAVAGTVSSLEELTDDMNVLQQAQYERTAAVEERFGIDIRYVDVSGWKNFQGQARQSISSGSDDYQLMFGCASQQVNLINEGLYLPHDELPYVDINKPWWNKEYIESVSLHEDELYLLFGDMTYNMLQRTCCVFFNINLLEEKLNMKPEDLYDLVYAGEWTIDKFTELVSAVYEDANGNTINDEDDIHGLTYLGQDPFNWMAFSSGLEYTTRDENGYPHINVNTETTIDMLDKLCALFFNNESVFKTSNADGTNRDFAKLFGEGKALFCVNRFFIADWEQVRVMTDDYGILPMPKYSEDIDGYHSTVESLVQWCTVPVTVVDPVYVSAVAEAFAYESRQRTTPAYYETTLKLKNTRDDASIEMIDMIMSGRDTDYLYINPLNGLGNVFKTVFKAGQNNFASAYAAVEMAGTQALADLIEQYEEAN
ncbi:MAG: extracellular solute-binding protein [Clostridia bacterium]|nr:extracellular solute-binding protein [Clostridia bacterium]